MRGETQSSTMTSPQAEPVSSGERKALDIDAFRQMIAVERKRTERTMAPFLLMLLEITNKGRQDEAGKAFDCILSVLMASTRDTDVVGWYKERAVVGAMFTGLVGCDKQSVTEAIVGKVSSALQGEMAAEQFEAVTISCHFFPDDWDSDKPCRQNNPNLYPDLLNNNRERLPRLMVKRAIDILGSALFLILCSPVFLLIALAVRMSSKGPIFFRQRRVGQYGQCFTFLKFRSMY